MKKFFSKKKKSASEVGSLASGKSGSGFEVATKKDLSKLHKAAFSGDLTKLKTFLKKGDVNQLDKENRTALHHACGNGKIDAVVMLVNHPGCNLNLCDNERRSPLILCVQSQFYNCMGILLQQGADVNLSDVNGNTALHIASRIPSKELCNLLLDSHADVHAKNKDGATPLHLAASVAQSEQIMKTLIDDGAQVDEKDTNGKTPLMLAASRGHLEVVQNLLARGADTSARDNKGWTADDYASMSGHHPIAHIIVEHSMKQKKTPSKTSMASPNGSGSHLYEDVLVSSQGLQKKPMKLSSNVMIGGPAVDLGDLSQEEDSQTVSKSSENSWSSASDVSPAPAHKPTASNKPKVNVAAFLKQREQSKNTGSSSNHANASLKFNAAADDEEIEEENLEVKPVPTVETPKMRSGGYASASQKGGHVSPAKPPLPMSRSTTDVPYGNGPTTADKTADDSPWDSEEEDEDIVETAKDDVARPRPGQHNQKFEKPSKDILSELGFSAAEAGVIYSDPESEPSRSTSSHAGSQHTDSPDVPIYSTVNKKPQKSSEPESVEESSSNWDDSGDEQMSNEQKTPVAAVVASSLKFDDEISEDDDDVSIHHSSSDVLKQIEANEVLDDSASSSSWDSGNVDQRIGENTPTAAPRQTKATNNAAASRRIPSVEVDDDDDDVLTSESASSWELETRERREKQDRDAEKRSAEQQAIVKGKNETTGTVRTVSFQETRDEQEETRRIEQIKKREEERKKSEEEKKKRAEEIRMEVEKRKLEEERNRALEDELHKQREEAQRSEERRKVEEKEKERKRALKAEKEKQRTLAAQAMEKRRKAEENRKRKEEEERQLLLSHDREKLETALQDALDGAVNPSESDISELDDQFMGNAHQSGKKKTDGIKSHWQLNLPPVRQMPSAPTRLNGHVTNGVDLDNLTGTETETEDDMPADIPASLRSSQFSDALLKSGERGELEREASREKRRAVDAMEKLDFAQRENEKLRDQIRDMKRDKDEWTTIKDGLEAKLRKTNFDVNRYKEQLESADLEIEMTRERQKRLDDKLELDAADRKQNELALRELRSELTFSKERLTKTEAERDELRQKLAVERHQVTLRERIESEKDRVDREISEETAKNRHVDALSLLLQEKETELLKVKADRDTLGETCRRYEDELDRWRTNEEGVDSLATKLNKELSENVVELTREKREIDDALQQAAIQFNMKLHIINQANDALTDQLAKERNAKENALRDLETLNDQQRTLKERIGDLDVKCKKEEDRAILMERDGKEARERKEELERKLHTAELSQHQSQQEANNLRTALAHKESLLVQAQREREETKEQLRRREVEANELQRENARLQGRAEMLEVDVTQQETDRLKLRRELEDARTFGTSTLTSQQGKLTDIVTEHQKEKIELEKENAKLEQQVAHLSGEIKRINDEKIRKDEELARAQQDRIDTHKHMSFTESSMTQMTESQRQLNNDKAKLQQELLTLKDRCSQLESRAEESSKLAAELQNELNAERQSMSSARSQLDIADSSRSSDKATIHRLEQRLKEIEPEIARLEAEVTKASSREQESKVSEDILQQSLTQMEELIGRLQEEKAQAEEVLQEQTARYQLLEEEADGHKRMWESEVKARSKLSMQFARADKERKDCVAQLESYKKKYTRIAEQSKSFKTKYELQQRKNARLEERVDSYSDIAREARLRSETSESEFEDRLSRASDEFRGERSRLDEKIQRLQSEVVKLNRRLKEEGSARRAAEANKEKLTYGRANDSSPRTDVERERDQLRNELCQLKESFSARGDPEHVNAIVNKELSNKLGQVNSFLEEREVALDVLERLRSENEEKRVAAERERADSMSRELDEVKRRLAASASSDGSDRSKDLLQNSTRENLKLQEELRWTKRELDERKFQVQHEKKKYQTLYTSMMSGAVAGNLGSSYPPILGNSLTALPLFKSLSPEKTMRDAAFTSTPRKDLSEPILTQLRNKLDISIAQRLAESRNDPPVTDRAGSSQRRPDRGKSPSTEYMSFLQT